MSFDPDELYRWIDGHNLTRPKKNINRDFSDAVPLAEILKQHFPKLVELHNYSPKNSFSQKLINWEVINRKVLNKMRINLTSYDMERLAKGVPGSIEKLLTSIKTKVENKASGDNQDSSRVYYLDDGSNFSSRDGIIPVKIKNGTTTVDRKMVSNEIFEKMESDLAEKDEIIETLQKKVEHLENLVAVKEERIKDLTQQLQSIINGSTDTSNILSPKSRFFNKIF